MPLHEQLLMRGVDDRVRPPSDDQAERRCPLLWGLLTQDTYRDGTIRHLPSIRVERVSGAYRVILQDHASHQQIEAMATTLAGIGAALERAMRAPDPQWRSYRSPIVKDPGKRAKRRNP